MQLKEITYSEEVLNLYKKAGWIAYTKDPETLKKGFDSSSLILGAYVDHQLAGLIRVVGDEHTVILIQDLLVDSDYQRQGIGNCLIKEVLSRYDHVRQIQLCTDNTPETKAFYETLHLVTFEQMGCTGYIRIK